MMKTFARALALAALTVAPLAAQAEENGSAPYYKLKCHFDGKMKQDPDCVVQIKYCIASDAAPGVVAPIECMNKIHAKCGKRTVFKGTFEVTAPSVGTTLFSGVANAQYTTPANVLIANPTGPTPTTVEAAFEWNDVERMGQCHIRTVVPDSPPGLTD